MIQWIRREIKEIIEDIDLASDFSGIWVLIGILATVILYVRLLILLTEQEVEQYYAFKFQDSIHFESATVLDDSGRVTIGGGKEAQTRRILILSSGDTLQWTMVTPVKGDTLDKYSNVPREL